MRQDNPVEHDRQKKKLWYQANRTQVLAHYATKKFERQARSIAWVLAHPEQRQQISKRAHQKRRLAQPYDVAGERLFRTIRGRGLTLDQYHAFAESQDFCCAICGIVPEIKPRSSNHIDGFVIDHNHVTEKTRGLLCPNCNVALGQFRDNPETCRQAATYLESGFAHP